MPYPDLRRHIQAATTKVESFNNFYDWVTFGGKILKTGDPVEIEKRIKYADLIANIVMLHNVVDLTDVLHQMNTEGEIVSKELIEKLSPYMNQQLRRFGTFLLDMDDLPDPLQIKNIVLTTLLKNDKNTDDDDNGHNGRCHKLTMRITRDTTEYLSRT